ncbi:MAG: type IX secretion system membrane protein PorP/SprF [Chitinophagaceae bacterium]|nr:MAG: type IX secretion system membrane protein PorP/SprF [Chitinophagaceae bacterium]
MKKHLSLGMMMLLSAVVFAQQKPHYTQYILNQYIVNPALTGIENYVDIKASHRLQWVGIQDAPVTTYLTIQGPIGKSDYKTQPTSFSVPGENPRGKSYWEEYSASKPHHGIGLQVINDRTGPLNNFSAFGTYAYHVGLSPKTNLAAGIGLGISNISINGDKLQFSTPVDPAVYSSGLVNNLRFDMNAGLYLYSPDYFIGISAQQLVPSKIDFSNNIVKVTEGKHVPHFFATAGYRFLVGEDFNLIPSVMVKYVQPAPVQVEMNAKLQYRDLIWVGAGYRHNDGVAAMIGLNVSNTFNVGYAYDYTTSKLNNYTKGTHEIVVGFTIGNKFGDSCPRNVW